MQSSKSKFFAVLAWLLPSGMEVVIYTTLSFGTLAVSNLAFLKDTVSLPQDFQLKDAVLGSADTLVQRFVGDQVGRSAVVAIFWGTVGLGVYVLIWMGLNFSGELGNDLAVTKYVHPRNVDTHSPLRDLVSRIVFQFFVLCILIFFINLMIAVLLPYFSNLFRTTITEWPKLIAFKYAVIGIISELIVLHFFTILVRLLTLRKRVFGE